MQRLLLVITVLLLACGTSAKDTEEKGVETPNSPSQSACPAPEFRATQPVRNLDLTAERGPVAELGSHADLIWTFPDPETETGRIMGVELFRGRLNPLMNSPFEGEQTSVRGFSATLGSIEGGRGLLWEEGSEVCDRYALTGYGLTRDELISFANGLT